MLKEKPTYRSNKSTQYQRQKTHNSKVNVYCYKHNLRNHKKSLNRQSKIDKDCMLKVSNKNYQ